MKNKSIYHISPGYCLCVIWTGDSTGRRISTTKITPKRGMTRRERYEALLPHFEAKGIKPPRYQHTEAP